MEKINIMIVDDHAVIRRGFAEIIKQNSKLRIVEEAENGEVALQKLKQILPDIVVLDYSMPGLDGYETAKIINSVYPQIKIVFVSVHQEIEVLNQVSSLNMMGYVLKDSGLLEIVECLIKVSNGEKYFSQSVKEHLRKANYG